MEKKKSKKRGGNNCRKQGRMEGREEALKSKGKGEMGKKKNRVTRKESISGAMDEMEKMWINTKTRWRREV